MASVDLQAVIERSPATVFAALAALGERPLLDPTITELSPRAPAPKVGATFEGRGTFTGSDVAFEGIVAGLEAGELLVLQFVCANGARLAEEWRLGATMTGTLLSYHADLRLPGELIGRILDRFFVGSGFEHQREAVLTQFRRRLNSTPGR